LLIVERTECRVSRVRVYLDKASHASDGLVIGLRRKQKTFLQTLFVHGSSKL